jgi:polyisoprenoid-binding protein YceI
MSFKIDQSHSQIQFTVRHMMISKVRGQFEKYDGTFQMDEQNPENSIVNVRIETDSINTRDEKRDGHLRSADFFDAEKYPYITFQSKRVELVDDNTAKLHGDLTIKNVTKPVVLDVEYNGSAKSPWGTTSFGFNALTTINRKEWGLGWNVALETGGVLVGDDINIDIELELVKEAETEAAAA